MEEELNIDNDLNQYLTSDVEASTEQGLSYNDYLLSDGQSNRALGNSSISYEDYLESERTGELSNPFSIFNDRQLEGDFIESKYLTPWDDPRETELNKEKMASRQGWGTKAASGLGRFGTKVLSEISKMPGVVGGIGAGMAGQLTDLATGRDNTDFMQTAFNNPWIKAIEGAEEWVKEDILPVHVRKAVTDGNLWDNITSIDFWATEGADGLGYIVSMLAPGAAINKIGLGTKLLKTGRLARMGAKTEAAALKLNKLGVKAKNIDLHTSTVANTLFEAGAEARGAMDSYEDKLQSRRYLDPKDPDYLDDAKFEELMAKQSEVGRNVFIANAGILIGPNAVMSKMIWGNRLNKGKLKLNKKTGFFDKIKGATTKQAIKKGGDRFLAGTAREGFFEEGLQSTAETYFAENESNAGLMGAVEDMSGFIGDLGNAYLNTIATVDGQKAIFLGSVFGGTMQAVMEGKTDVKKVKSQNSLIDNANKMLGKFDAFFSTDNEVDAEGNEITDADGVLQKRAKAVIEKAEAIDELEQLSKIYDEAVEEGNEPLMKDIKELMTTHLIMPFILNDELGIDALKQYLEASSTLIAQSEKEEFDKQEYITEILDKAKDLKEAYSTFEGFNDIFIELNNKEATPAMKSAFLNNMSSKYINNKSLQRYNQKKLDEASKNYKIAAESWQTTPEELKNNPDKLRDLAKNDARLRELPGQVAQLEKNLKNINEVNANIWNEAKINKSFDEYVKEDIKATKDQEDADMLTELTSALSTATTKEEIDDVEIPQGKVYTPVLEKMKQDAYKAVKEAVRAKGKETSKENQEELEAEARKKAKEKDELDFIANQFEPGDYIPTYGLTVPEEFQENVKVHSIVDGVVTIENEAGETHVIDVGEFYIENYDPENQFSNQDSSDVETEDAYENMEPHKIKAKRDARIAITDNNPGTKGPMFPDLQEAYEIEISPVSKNGYKGVSVNNADTVTKGNSKFAKAFAEFQLNGVTAENIDQLTDDLSLNINLTPDVGAPLDTKPAKGKYQEVYETTTAKLRRVIFQELLSGTPLSDIQIQIVGQYAGEIQLDMTPEGKPAENNIAELHYFDSVSDVASNLDNFYIVDDKGDLVNHKGDELGAQRKLAKGEVYLAIPMANGKIFPLKLNSAKITTEQADFLYSLFDLRWQDFENGKIKKDAPGKARKVPTELVAKFKTTFPQVWEIFSEQGMEEEDMTIKDVQDFFVFGMSSNIDARVRFNNGKLQIGRETFTEEEFKENKDKFIEALTSSKRQHIRFKPRVGKDAYNFTMTNPKYLEYLIRNNILNTNATKTGPIFRGRTTMYVSTSTVQVNGVDSKHNDKTVVYNDNLFGDKVILKKVLPQLFEKGLKQTDDKKNYKDTFGALYDRVSTLVPYTGNVDNNSAANKRGNVIDLLIRDFFASTQELTTQERFNDKAQKYIKEQNGLQAGDVLKMDDTFLETLMTVFKYYAVVFNELEYTVYSDVPPVAFKMNDTLYAGTVDLLIYDNKNKVWKIIDLKTASSDRQDSYDRTDKHGYKKKDVVQQNAYLEGFRQTAKVDINSLEILPITSQPNALRGKALKKAKEEGTDTGTGNYVGQKAERTSVDFLPVSMEKDIYELMKWARQEMPAFSVTDYEQEDDIDIFGELDAEFNPDDYGGVVPDEIKEEKEAAKRKPSQQVSEIETKKKEIPLKATGKPQMPPSIIKLHAEQRAKGDYDKITVGGQSYGLTYAIIEDGKVVGGLVAFQQEPITDRDLYFKIIQERNNTSKGIFKGMLGQPNFFFSETSIAKAYRRNMGDIKSEVTQLDKVEKIDFSKFTDAEAKAILKQFKLKGYFKGLDIKSFGQTLKGKTQQQMLEITVKFLTEQKQNKEEEIKNLCKKN